MHTHSYLHAHTHTQVVMFQVLDHHTRRNAEEGRVVGALLGSVGSDGTVSLKNGACVLQCVQCVVYCSTLQCGVTTTVLIFTNFSAESIQKNRHFPDHFSIRDMPF